jgi:hypothetical protein
MLHKYTRKDFHVGFIQDRGFIFHIYENLINFLSLDIQWCQLVSMPFFYHLNIITSGHSSFRNLPKTNYAFTIATLLLIWFMSLLFDKELLIFWVGFFMLRKGSQDWFQLFIWCIWNFQCPIWSLCLFCLKYMTFYKDYD